MRKTIGVLGGDLRQSYLARLLREDGWDVAAWGLEKSGMECPVPLDKVLDAKILILPLPVCREGQLNLPLTDTVLSAEELWRRLGSNQLLFGGAVGSLSKYLFERYGLEMLDYFEREDVQVANAIPTAEGAIMRMMEETDHTVQGSRCLIIGYGRIGKALAQRLQTLGAFVTVAARKAQDIAWIKACGYRAAAVNELREKMEEFDVIFNTAPATVLGEELLRLVRPDVLLLELASLPGGFDENAVKDNNLHIIVERGLPGKTAPLSAARVIRDGIYHILEERGEEV